MLFRLFPWKSNRNNLQVNQHYCRRGQRVPTPTMRHHPGPHSVSQSQGKTIKVWMWPCLWAPLAQDQSNNLRNLHRGALHSVPSEKVAPHSRYHLELKLAAVGISLVPKENVTHAARQSRCTHFLQRRGQRTL